MRRLYAALSSALFVGSCSAGSPLPQPAVPPIVVAPGAVARAKQERYGRLSLPDGSRCLAESPPRLLWGEGALVVPVQGPDGRLTRSVVHLSEGDRTGPIGADQPMPEGWDLVEGQARTERRGVGLVIRAGGVEIAEADPVPPRWRDADGHECVALPPWRWRVFTSFRHAVIEAEHAIPPGCSSQARRCTLHVVSLRSHYGYAQCEDSDWCDSERCAEWMSAHGQAEWAWDHCLQHCLCGE